MKPTHLRIGNIINNPKGELIEVCGIKIIKTEEQYFEKVYVDVCENYYHATALTPIPLTEDWLIKFGYIKSGNFRFTGRGFIDLFSHKNNVTCSINDIEINLRYVHQLQNLFFALMGFELEIKE